MIRNWSTPRMLGTTALEVTPICIGTSPLANLPNLYGYDVGEETALTTLRAAFAGHFNFVDTSNGYGNDNAERFFGKVILEMRGLPDGFVLETKVDADPVTKAREYPKRSVSRLPDFGMAERRHAGTYQS
jgi:D-threo-aldose 1-dehydrogenase